MKTELDDDGHETAFVLINGPDDAFPSLLANKADFPIFQDTHEVGAWAQHGGGKDDIVVYGIDHALHTFFDYGTEPSSNLSDANGYDNVKSTILDALGAPP